MHDLLPDLWQALLLKLYPGYFDKNKCNLDLPLKLHKF